jgi:hypothetical protein
VGRKKESEGAKQGGSGVRDDVGWVSAALGRLSGCAGKRECVNARPV